jgi:hypothetical protein
MRCTAPRSEQRAPAPPHQLNLTLDHARLRGVTASERRAVIRLLARLLSEAKGIATGADGDDRA